MGLKETMKKVSFYTLGCKLNQSETAILAEQFIKNEYEIVPFDQPADVCVVNTCTVTAKTDYRCRQMIRRAKKISPNAKIAVVGCYAQLQPSEIRKINGVDLVLGSDRKFELVRLLDEQPEGFQQVISDNYDFQCPWPGHFWDHTRGFLKIQDGCNNRCSYCTVPLARGDSRSDTIENICRRAKILAKRGHKELVLTGVHIGMYGQDLKLPINLTDVVRKVETIRGVERIRLSSLEPREINDELLQLIKQSKKVCRHLHVPLQTGDDKVLQRMNRNYDSSTFTDIIKKINFNLPEAGLGTDIIVGFPGETEEQFNNTKKLVEQLPFTYLHVFSYSKRPGTDAAIFTEQINPKIIKKRSEILREIAQNKKAEFYRSQVKKVVNVLWEEQLDNDEMTGLTDNYIRVRADLKTELLKGVSPVKIIRSNDDFVYGKVLAAHEEVFDPA